MKTILITGSSRGIGRAIAIRAHQQGYKVVLNGKSDSPHLQTLHQELPGSIKAVFDVANKAQTHQAIAEVLTQVGTIDVLVNNAGIARNFIKDISELDDDKAIEEHNTNILGLLHCVQVVLPGMLAQKSGSVINIASIKGHYNLSTLSTLTYGATKAGVLALTKSLAKAYGAQGVRFNSVSPGYIETDQVADWNEETFKRISDGTIAGRIGKVEEIAPVVLFLASDDASYITGADFLADGGYAIKGK